MADVRCIFYYMIAEMGIGASFHPDTPIDEYVDDAGYPIFQRGGGKLQKQLDECFHVCKYLSQDIYDVSFKIAQSLGITPRPDTEKIQMVFLFGAESIYEFERMDANIDFYERLQAVTEDSGYYENRSFYTQAELDAYRLGLNDMNDDSHWKGILVGWPPGKQP